jgi:hypothetical protein
MTTSSFIKVASFFSSFIILSLLVVALGIYRHGPGYKGRSVEAWFRSKDVASRERAFRQMGSQALPFLFEKFQHDLIDRIAACEIVGRVYQAAEVERAGMKPELETMLTSSQQAEQIAAYSTIRNLGLQVPESEITAAVETCPAVRAYEREAHQRQKLALIQIMTNELNCSAIAELCNDYDPQVQLLTLGFLDNFERIHGDRSSCHQEIAAALLSLVKTTKDRSTLRAAVAYIAGTQDRTREYMEAVCELLQATNCDLQVDCLALLATYSRTHSLPSDVTHSLELVREHPLTDPDARRIATELLKEPKTK